MPYSKQTWNDNDASTPLSASRLSHMEDGIALIDDHTGDMSGAHSAQATSFSPTGTITATNTQDAVAQVSQDTNSKLAQVQDEGTPQTTRQAINFTGAGVIAADNPTFQRTDVVISGLPQGAAGGVLGGNYPNPTFAADMATQSELDAHINNTTTAHLVEFIQTFSYTGTLVTATGASRFRFPWAATILGVTAAVGTAPTGASLIIDVNKNGTTIFTTQANRPAIAVSTNATTSEPTPNVTSIAAGDYLTVDIDQIGSTVAGADLTVFVRYRRA